MNEVPGHSNAGEDANRPATLTRVIPRALQCFPGELQEDAMLRIDQLRLSRRNAEERRIERGRSFENSAATHVLRRGYDLGAPLLARVLRPRKCGCSPRRRIFGAKEPPRRTRRESGTPCPRWLHRGPSKHQWKVHPSSGVPAATRPGAQPSCGPPCRRGRAASSERFVPAPACEPARRRRTRPLPRPRSNNAQESRWSGF